MQSDLSIAEYRRVKGRLGTSGSGCRLLTCALFLVIAACGDAPDPKDPPGPKACAGKNCLRWSGVKSAQCEIFNPDRPNRSYAITSNLFPPELPITAFYAVIRRDAGGKETELPDEITYRLPGGQKDLAICHAARIGDQIYTHIIKNICTTSRVLPVNATSADCLPKERYSKAEERFEINSSVSHNLAASLTRNGTTLVPDMLAHDDPIDCTHACDGFDECIPITSLNLSAALTNLITAWKPGKALNKQDLMRAIGDEEDRCKREDKFLAADGAFSNSASKECSLPIELSGLKAELILGTNVAGTIEVTDGGRSVEFEQGAEMGLKLPDDAAIYDGPVTEMKAPGRKKFIDFRTPGMCFRVTPR